MLKVEKKLTFKPLSRGRYRCSNGVITKNSKHTRALFENRKRKSMPVATKSVVAEWDHHWYCPHCEGLNQNGYTGEAQCRGCGRSVNIIGVANPPVVQRSSSWYW